VVQRFAGIGSWRVAAADAPDPAWLDVYAGAEGADGRSLAVRRAIMAAIPDRACYVVAHDAAGQPAAVGSAIAADGYLGFFNVATVPTQRRRGAARAVMGALLEWGAAVGAVEAYLQVMTDNTPGLALYASLGFETCYHYHYREQRRDSPVVVVED
jgi:ribosomal protein S18 acetylase RimI-like enzyme